MARLSAVMIAAIALLCCVEVALSQGNITTACKFAYTDKAGDIYVYDLSSLKLPFGKDYHGTDSQGLYAYYLNVCAAVGCTQASPVAGVCQMRSINGEWQPYHALGDYSAGASWDVQHHGQTGEPEPKKGLEFHLVNGDACVGSERKATIRFHCDPSAKNPVSSNVSVEARGCDYHFGIRTAAACPTVTAAGDEDDSAEPGLRAEFESWMERFDRVYDSDMEYERKFVSWRENKKFVETHNARTDSTFTVAMNQFADMSRGEWKDFIARSSGGIPFIRRQRAAHRHIPARHHAATAAPPRAQPTTVDWRPYIGPIQNQQQCGSSPYFAALDAVTVVWSRGMKVAPFPVSVQQVIDCSFNEGNEGCNGGEMYDTYQYIIDNKGICSDAAYPYQGVESPNGCAAVNCTSAAHITSYVNVPAEDEAALYQAVAVTAVASAVDGQCQSFQMYSGGIFNDPTCDQQADHGISVMGYGVDTTTKPPTPYWLLRNFWGTTWGEAGYARIIRGFNQSDISSLPSYPVLKTVVA